MTSASQYASAARPRKVARLTLADVAQIVLMFAFDLAVAAGLFAGLAVIVATVLP
jgi:hypothetical protein